MNSMTGNDADGNHFRFLGMTKLQALGAASAIIMAGLVICILLLSLTVRSANRRADASERRADAAQVEATEAHALSLELHSVGCAQKRYAEEQVQSTQSFLDSNPGPEPIPGITRQALLTQLARQQAFRDSMNGLECPPRA